MAIDTTKIMADLKILAQPKLEEVATTLRANFLADVKDFTDQSRIHKLDDLLKQAAQLHIKSITESDENIAGQYAASADSVLRQVSLLVVAERIVASKEAGALLQAAALTVWKGFREVAGAMLGVAIQGAVAGILGPAGGAIGVAAGNAIANALQPKTGSA